MKQSAYEKARDQAIADEANAPKADDDRGRLMCAAKGCPRQWAVAGDWGRACSAHYWADRSDWPRITQQLLEAEQRSRP